MIEFFNAYMNNYDNADELGEEALAYIFTLSKKRMCNFN